MCALRVWWRRRRAVCMVVTWVNVAFLLSPPPTTTIVTTHYHHVALRFTHARTRNPTQLQPLLSFSLLSFSPLSHSLLLLTTSNLTFLVPCAFLGSLALSGPFSLPHFLAHEQREGERLTCGMRHLYICCETFVGHGAG